MEGPDIRRENVETLLDKRFLRLYDLQYAPGKHYYNASRRLPEDLVAIKSGEEFRQMQPDAVSCAVILEAEDCEPRLLLTREYRYPAGQFLLSIPAGLMDPEDLEVSVPAFATAIREIREETGLEVGLDDSISLVNPLLFSTPGMTDESNALVCVRIHVKEGFTEADLSTEGLVGSECFDGFCLVTKEEAAAFLKSGRDAQGNFYSIYTWACLMWFVTGLWADEEIGIGAPAHFEEVIHCPVCGIGEFEKIGAYEICENCGWEDDPVQRRDISFAGGANKMSLREAREAYRAKHLD